MILEYYNLLLKLLKNILEREYHNISLWYFVSFISGIVIYFSLGTEPSFIVILIFFTVSILLLVLRHNIFWRFISGLIIAFLFGILISKYRVSTLHVATIEKPIISRISGTIESMKPSIHGMQIILKQVTIHKTKKLLEKIRLSISQKYVKNIGVGDSIDIIASLYKSQSSIIPGSYDFAFYAYLASIGATGYAMSSPNIISHHNFYINNLVYKIKKNIYNRLIQVIGSTKGNFIAAILLGETKAIDRQLMKEMRQSGISHILCVSGLHLSLVAMIFFISTRFLLNLSNYVAYNYNIKSIAATCSLLGSYCYLELSGIQIAATRAFIMTVIFIYASQSGRSIYPLRSLAIAAFIILSISPEYVFHPSFQLSFVAVLSLMAGYEFYIKNQWMLGESKGIFASLKFYLASNIYSSFLASIVTAPVVVNQFYTFPTYSIPMNLIAVPIMSFFLMPLSIISLFLMLFGADQYCLIVIGFFINIIIESARFANSLPLAVWHVGYITNTSLITFLFGFFWICLWKTKWRFLGIAIMFIAIILMLYSPKPSFIFDAHLNALGVKNNSEKLEIYANQMSEFKRLYWANWFGQKDATIFPLNKYTYIADKITLLINFNNIIKNDICQNADIYINIFDNGNCMGNKITISKDILNKLGVIMIFCDHEECKIVANNNKRFSF